MVEFILYTTLAVVGTFAFGFSVGIWAERRAWVVAANRREDVYCEQDIYRVTKVDRKI